MWLLAVSTICFSIFMLQISLIGPPQTVKINDAAQAKQALLYATAVASYLRNNPTATSPATDVQLNLPTWFPKTCSGATCFSNAFAGGRAYITAKPGTPALKLNAVLDAQDGSLIAGVFTNTTTGAFLDNRLGAISLAVPAGATVNTPTIVVNP